MRHPLIVDGQRSLSILIQFIFKLPEQGILYTLHWIFIILLNSLNWVLWFFFVEKCGKPLAREEEFSETPIL
jgi:hypothetical protein